MKIEDYKLGQKVSLYGRIEAIDIENIHDKENTTTLKINTLARTISVNPKWEEVTIDLDQPKLEVPQMIFDVIESFDDDVDYLHEHMSRQPSEVREWLTHNERDFYEAWLAYPNITVEKEKLYTVEILGNKLYKMTSDNHTRYRFFHKTEALPFCNFYEYSSKLTESEVKASDERLWQFAKEVTDDRYN